MVHKSNLHKQLLFGLPGSGKTTFLAALWEVIESGYVENALNLSRLEGSIENLTTIQAAWQKCEELRRTNPKSEQTAKLVLQDVTNEDLETELHIPDFSGEHFRDQWEKRQSTKTLDNLVSELTGALLLIHADKIDEPQRIDQADPIAAIVETEANVPDSQSLPEIEWDPSIAPTQVKLVELLQVISTHRDFTKPFRLAVLISAWDLVPNYSAINPEDWLKDRLPLLYQFLQANESDFIFRIYGVSAQGADYASGTSKLLKHSNPSQRIIIIGEDCEPHDLTSPVKWIMST